MKIGGLQKLTLIDYPGKLAATVFLSGCNLRCPWCYSSELVLPEKIDKHPKISEDEFFEFLKYKKGLLDAVVICGGEPTINNDLPDFIKKIKEVGFLVKLDTNGSNPEMLEELINKKLIDYVAMDIKTSKEKYPEIFGNEIKIEDIEESIEMLKRGDIDYEFRSTILPQIHSKEDVINIAKWIKGSRVYYLQQFRPEKTLDPEFEKIKPYPLEYLLEIQKAISPFFDICQIR